MKESDSPKGGTIWLSWTWQKRMILRKCSQTTTLLDSWICLFVYILCIVDSQIRAFGRLYIKRRGRTAELALIEAGRSAIITGTNIELGIGT